MSAAAWPRPRVHTALVGALLALAGCGPTAVVDRRADGRAILIRSPQPDADDLAELAAREGVQTVVNLRGAAPGEAWFEEERRGVEAIGARWVQHETSGRAAPGPRWVETTLALLADEAAWPILVHCEGGVHRTGLVVALYRMAIQGWSAARAIEELEDEWFDWTLVDRDAIRRFLRRGVGAAGNSPPRVPSPSPPDASPAAEEDDGWPGTCGGCSREAPMRRAFDLLLGITSAAGAGEQSPVRTFRAEGAACAPLSCFEVELPYRDAEEARAQGLAEDASLSFVVHAWAADVDGALDCALAWFEDLRSSRAGVRRVDVEPIVRRLGATEGARRVA